MRCYKCNQDSLKIKDGCILCEGCGIDIDLGNIEDSYVDLLSYNIDMDEAEKLGECAYLENKSLEDNPYSLDGDKRDRWVQGYNKEKMSYDFSALSLSAEKIEEERKELRESVKRLNKENWKLVGEKEVLLSEKVGISIKLIKIEEYFEFLKKQRYIWGASYRKYLQQISLFPGD